MLAVHTEISRPCFTVLMPDGYERNTVLSYLHALDGDRAGMPELPAGADRHLQRSASPAVAVAAAVPVAAANASRVKMEPLGAAPAVGAGLRTLHAAIEEQQVATGLE